MSDSRLEVRAVEGDEATVVESPEEIIIAVVSQALLFLLLAGMAGSVEVAMLRAALRKWKGIAAGLTCQFVVLPCLGFFSAVIFDLPPRYGVALLATTSAPGGAYSNWWCSMMNADLALSIAMTTCSTAASCIFMPLNMIGYTTAAYGSTPSLSWPRLLGSIGVAVGAVLAGTTASALCPRRRRLFNVGGNLSGIALIVFGAAVSSSGEPLWDKEPYFYPAVALPCLAGMAISSSAAFLGPCLSRPEAVSVIVETTYQNTGLALSIALTTFGAEDRGHAAGVPLFYAVVQILALPSFLVVAWKLGCTYAPPSTPFLKMFLGDFQPAYAKPSASKVSPTRPCPATVQGDTGVVAAAALEEKRGAPPDIEQMEDTEDTFDCCYTAAHPDERLRRRVRLAAEVRRVTGSDSPEAQAGLILDAVTSPVRAALRRGIERSVADACLDGEDPSAPPTDSVSPSPADAADGGRSPTSPRLQESEASLNSAALGALLKECEARSPNEASGAQDGLPAGSGEDADAQEAQDGLPAGVGEDADGQEAWPGLADNRRRSPSCGTIE